MIRVAPNERLRLTRRATLAIVLYYTTRRSLTLRCPPAMAWRQRGSSSPFADVRLTDQECDQLQGLLSVLGRTHIYAALVLGERLGDAVSHLDDEALGVGSPELSEPSSTSRLAAVNASPPSAGPVGPPRTSEARS